MSLEIGESAFYTKKIMTRKGIGWGLFEVHIINIGTNYSFVKSTWAFEDYEIMRLKTASLFPTKKEAMINVPNECRDFIDHTTTGLSPNDNNSLSVEEKIRLAKS